MWRNNAVEDLPHGVSLMPQSLSIFNTASPQTAAIRNLSFLVLAITGFIFLVVEGVLILATGGGGNTATKRTTVTSCDATVCW
jgi:heme/copper-type cytochrome/quinol oxidase subunit 2